METTNPFETAYAQQVAQKETRQVVIVLVLAFAVLLLFLWLAQTSNKASSAKTEEQSDSQINSP